MVSTVLSLVVVPAFHLIMDDLSNLVARMFRNLIGAKEAEPDALTPEELTRRLAEREAEIGRLSARLDRRVAVSTQGPWQCPGRRPNRPPAR